MILGLAIIAGAVFLVLMVHMAGRSGYERGRLDGLAEADTRHRPARPDYAVVFQRPTKTVGVHLPPEDWKPDVTWHGTVPTSGPFDGMRMQKISPRPAADSTINYLTSHE